MTTKRDYYEILDINKDASKQEIKKAYKKLALKYHPDMNKDKDASEKFKEISEAYAVLSDDTKRLMYDQYGHAGFDQRFSQEDIFRGVNFDDIFRDIFGEEGFFGNNIFDIFFGGGGRSGFRRQRRGSDLRFDLEISFDEAVNGTTKNIRLPKQVKCSRCNGTGAKNEELIDCSDCNGTGELRKTRRTMFGMFSQISTCGNCQGSGEIAKEACNYCYDGLVDKVKTINVKIPGGIDTGNRLRISGEGEEIKNGESGDLYVVLNVATHKYFERRGSDIYLEVPISFSQAALGSQIQIPTLHSKVKVKVPAGTQSGTILRLKGKGIKDLHSNKYGDQYIKIKVKTPTKLTRKAKKLLTDLGKETKEQLKIEKGFFDKIRDVL